MAADDRHKKMASRALHGRTEDTGGSFQTDADLSRVNKLSEVVEKALTATSHGEFFEASRSSNTARDHQLGPMFALRAELQDLKAGLEKKDRCSHNKDEEEESSKNVTKLNKSMTDAINNMISQQVDDKLRDLDIKNERLEQRVAKAEQENDVLSNALQKAGITVKKKKTNNAEEQKLKVKRLEESMNQVKNSLQVHATKVTSIDQRLVALEKRAADSIHAVQIEACQRELVQVRGQVDDVLDRLGAMEDEQMSEDGDHYVEADADVRYIASEAWDRCFPGRYDEDDDSEDAEW